MGLSFQENVIFWQIPEVIKKDLEFDKVFIYRSFSENKDYSKIDEIPSRINSEWVNQYKDTSPEARRDRFYLVTYYKTQKGFESDYLLTFFPPTPKEKRLIEEIRNRIPRIISDYLSDLTIRSSLKLSVQHFNSVPPWTKFVLDNFPTSLENLLLLGAYYFSVWSQFLPVSIRDFRTSIAGYSLDVTRTDKIRAALEETFRMYNAIVKDVKRNFVSQGYGMGTVQLPISLGGALHRGILNVFDILRMSL
jgi:hypothetical protein